MPACAAIWPMRSRRSFISSDHKRWNGSKVNATDFLDPRTVRGPTMGVPDKRPTGGDIHESRADVRGACTDGRSYSCWIGTACADAGRDDSRRGSRSDPESGGVEEAWRRGHGV